jgi:two-component system OmpR family sensor kinase
MIRYLILSFILMGVVGYFLGRLFLAPVHEKIESLDKFIDDTTHELNTPITAILMTIESLKGCDAKKLKRLEVSAKRLSLMYDSLTYRLRDKNKESTNETFELSQLLKERLDYFKELIDAKKLTVQLHLDELMLSMDNDSAIRLIDNLFSNAIKYNDPGGSITLSTEGDKLIVADDGIGIDPSVQKEIFKRYRRADKDRGGFGIGLDIVLSVCKQYDIGIDVESERGKGSRFTLNFRRVKA